MLGINNRNLSDFSVDIERTYELLADVPAGKTVVSESGFSTREQLDDLERVGVDAVLIGETLMRSAGHRGRLPRADRLRRAARDARQDLRHHAARGRRAGDVARRLGARLPALGAVQALRRPGRWPRGIARRMRRKIELVGVFVNQPLDEIAGLVEFLGLSHVQLHGDEGPSFCQAVAQRTGAKVIKAARIGHAADLRDLDRFHTDYHLLDTVADPGAYGGTGQTWDWTLLKQRRNKIPLIVAGGLNPDNVAEAIEATRPWGVDVNSGVESAPGVKDPEKLRALFAAVGDHSHAPVERGIPEVLVYPPPRRGRVRPHERPPAGAAMSAVEHRFGPYGGQYVPETLVPALVELEAAWIAARDDPSYRAELDALLNDYVGRPSPLYLAQRLSDEVGHPVYLKREDLNHTGAHKINNALGQTLLAKRMGKTRIIAETGAGSHGVATATACALLGPRVHRLHGHRGHAPPSARTCCAWSCWARPSRPWTPARARSRKRSARPSATG